MATERDPLRVSVIGRRDAVSCSHGRRCCSLSLSERYKNTCVTTRGGLVALLWSVVVNTLGLGSVLVVNTAQPFVKVLPLVTAASSYYTIALLLYPVAAVASQMRWTRFKSLFVASVIAGIGVVPFVILLALGLNTMKFSYLYAIPLLFIIAGLALFQSIEHIAIWH